jgi:hypothetical protein
MTKLSYAIEHKADRSHKSGVENDSDVGPKAHTGT